MNNQNANREPVLRIGPFRFTSTGVRVEQTTQVEDWLQPLAFALWCQRASPWWIGDLLLAGDARFGEAFSQACQGWVSGEQLQRYESIARRVPPENRRATLSWSAHAVVARLEPAKQREMLELAERNGWSSEELRLQVRAALGQRSVPARKKSSGPSASAAPDQQMPRHGTSNQPLPTDAAESPASREPAGESPQPLADAKNGPAPPTQH
ncbi:MAG: hypothetical protein KatS3mg110_3955 [Pirellulaceae bacterium]|nr:MAG: hypothetical protein KatS3mg110_3955 [Pirellulaceae bacterium]